MSPPISIASVMLPICRSIVAFGFECIAVHVVRCEDRVEDTVDERGQT